jgi:hypothetical protein
MAGAAAEKYVSKWKFGEMFFVSDKIAKVVGVKCWRGK